MSRAPRGRRQRQVVRAVCGHTMRPPQRWATLAIAASIACAEVAPLGAPLSPALTVPAGAHAVVTNDGLSRLAHAARLAIGSVHAAPVAPLAWANPDGDLDALTLTAQLVSSQLVVEGDHVLQLRLSLAVPPTGLVVRKAGDAACVASYAPKEVMLALSLRVRRDSTGHADVHLAASPVLSHAPGAVLAADGCVKPQQLELLVDHLRAALVTALAAKATAAATAHLRGLVPPTAEVSWRLGVPPQTMEVSTRWQDVSGGAGDVFLHNGQVGLAAMDIAFGATRHPCAGDSPPPAAVPAPLPPAPAGAPPPSAVLPRAWAIDAATLGRLAWAAHRGGLFCRGAAEDWRSVLPEGWAGRILPELAGGIGPELTGARLWPAGAPSLVWHATGPAGGAELRFADATLEVQAPVDGIELTVLRIRGTFRVGLGLLAAGSQVQLAVESAVAEAMEVTSPLGVPVAFDEETLAAVVASALRGIFSSQWSLTGLLSGTAVTSIVWSPGALWLWLDGVP